jgi:hypothetical protein
MASGLVATMNNVYEGRMVKLTIGDEELDYKQLSVSRTPIDITSDDSKEWAEFMKPSSIELNFEASAFNIDLLRSVSKSGHAASFSYSLGEDVFEFIPESMTESWVRLTPRDSDRFYNFMSEIYSRDNT